MGRVYLGIVEGRYAAVKQVLPHLAEDRDFLRHFGHELDNLSRLPDEVSVPLLASDRQARPPWFATAYIPGLTLGEAMALHGGPLPARALWLLLREAAGGLRAVHALGMVHRDLKPSNVMLTPDGATLIDFGVARALDQSRLTRTGMVVGTPAYMSPEQATASRELTGATDVFALGALLGYAAAGRPPFGDGSGVDVLYRIVHSKPDLDGLQALDRELAEVVEACLDKTPQARPTAERLFRLADRKAASDGPGWPAPVMELLAERAAFAAQATPQVAVEDAPEEQARPATVKETPIDELERPRRRTRLLLALVPLVLVAGTTIAVQLLPKTSATQAAGTGPSASAGTSASPSATIGPSGTPTSGTPSASATPSPSPSSRAASPSTGSGTGGGTNRTGSSSGTGSSGSTSSSTTPGSSTSTGTSASKSATASPSPTGSPPQQVTGVNSAWIYPGYTQTVTVNWNPQSDATSFDIHYTTSGTSQHPSVNTITNTTATHYAFTAYQGETSCFYIRARNKYGVSAWGTDGTHCFNV
jgi:serine/threonine protein kinase